MATNETFDDCYGGALGIRACPLKLGVIFGGTGPEHEASLSSARSVLDHLDRRRYSVCQFGIAKDGSWLVGDGAWRALYAVADRDLLPSAIRGRTVARQPASFQRFRGYPDSEMFDDVDCLFPLVDGAGGEDGVLQGLFGLLQKPFTGSGLRASAQCYDKWTMKRLAQAAGLPVARGFRVDRRDTLEETRSRVLSDIGHWNLVVKPVASGSSFGVRQVDDGDGLPVALSSAFAYGEAVLVEEYLENVELFVGVLGNAPNLTVASPAVDHRPKSRCSTYHDKYIADEPPLRCPTGLGEDIDRRARRLAQTAYEALGCRGFARVDIFFRPKSGELVLNEINTIPAFSQDCAFPLGMQRVGYDYPALLDRIVALAMETRAKVSVG